MELQRKSEFGWVELKGEKNSYTVLVGTSIPHCQQWVGHPDRKSSKETFALSNTLDGLNGCI